VGPLNRKRDCFDEQLLEEYHRVAETVGRTPTLAEFNRLSPVSMTTLQHRLGNKGEIERRYVEFKRRRAGKDVDETMPGPHPA
jgi:hypothetical protein